MGTHLKRKLLLNNKYYLLKIDIEGAEKELLGKNNDWLKDVDNIVVELHKPYNINDLRKDLEPFGFSISQPAPNNGLLNIFAQKLNFQ